MSVNFGISLSGGGARALVQLGIIQALHERSIYPKIYTGTSMGAVVGAFIASGQSPQDVALIFKNNLSRMSFSWLSLIRKSHKSLNALNDIFDQFFEENSFEHLKYPLFVSVTNLNSGKNEIISSGKLFEYLIASASIPIVFKPKVIDGTYYVDGGLTNNFPALVLQGKCDKIIGIHVNYIEPVDDFNGLVALAERMYQVGIYSTVRSKVHLCDYFIDPPECRKFNTFDFHKIDEIFDLGYSLGKGFAQKIIEVERL